MPNEPIVDEPVVDEPIVDDQPLSDGEPPVAGRVDLSKLPKEFMPIIEAVRSQEKAKLYKDNMTLRTQLKDARTRITDLERTPSAASPAAAAPVVTAAPSSDEVAELRSLVVNLTTTLEKRDRESSLRSYRTQAIAAAKEQGHKLIESLVAGDTEEAIDLSIQLAIAERMQIDAEHAAERAAAAPPVVPAARPVVVQPGKGRVAGVPATTTPGSANTGPSMSVEEFKELTSMEAIRDGRYAANKQRIMAAIRSKSVYTGANRA